MRSEKEIREELEMLREMKKANNDSYKDILLSMRLEALEWVLGIESTT